jgi:hypothetical protein
MDVPRTDLFATDLPAPIAAAAMSEVERFLREHVPI